MVYNVRFRRCFLLYFHASRLSIPSHLSELDPLHLKPTGLSYIRAFWMVPFWKPPFLPFYSWRSILQCINDLLVCSLNKLTLKLNTTWTLQNLASCIPQRLKSLPKRSGSCLGLILPHGSRSLSSDCKGTILAVVPHIWKQWQPFLSMERLCKICPPPRWFSFIGRSLYEALKGPEKELLDWMHEMECFLKQWSCLTLLCKWAKECSPGSFNRNLGSSRNLTA